VLPGEQKYMCSNEFLSLIHMTDILTISSVGDSEMGAIFSVSMMTKVDELSQDKHMRMSLIEFMEATVRVADILDKFPECAI
jgi:glycine cleavage system H lipoate-binding protein